MPANELSFNQISAEMNSIHAQAIGAQPPRAINTGAVITQAQAALLGADVQLVPLTVTENGTYNPPAGKGFGTVTANVPNPNYVETITGTLDNPWGNKDYDELISEINSNAITAKLVALVPGGGGASLSFVLETINEGESFGSGAFYNYSSPSSFSLNEAFYVKWNLYGALAYALITQGGADTDITAYASLATTTLTIIHHPLPEDAA